VSDRPQLFFEDVRIGDQVTALVKGPITTAHLVRWSAAIENWHRIHYDLPFSVEHDRNPGLLVNGSWKQHVLVQMMKDWVGREGWLWKIGFQFRAMNVAGETIHSWGRVTDKYEQDGLGIVECEIGIRNDAGLESTPGTATAVLPLRDGRPVPYPFVRPPGARS
jgi:acyl dehydratase